MEQARHSLLAKLKSFPSWKRYIRDMLLAIGGIMLVSSISFSSQFAPDNPILTYIYQSPLELCYLLI